MLYYLKRHPFPVQAHFEHCLVLTHAVPAEVLTPLLPPGLELDVVPAQPELGLVAIALVQTRSLRPAFLPGWLGQDFFLSGYRIFTRFRTPDGRSLRGLRIVRSYTDRPLMKTAGNLLTHYNYRLASVRFAHDADDLEISVTTPGGEANLQATVHLASLPARLPAGSCFTDLDQARRYAGPLPYTFDYEPQTHSMVAIRATRGVWKPQPVSVDVQENSFFQSVLGLKQTPPVASAFYVNNMDYRWERGVRYRLPQGLTCGRTMLLQEAVE